MKLQVVVFLLVHGANGAFFDLTDVDDPLSLFWHSNKDSPIIQKNAQCVVSLSGGGSATGQCRHKTLCLLSGGQTYMNDDCGSFLTCCTQQNICLKRTKSKISYFTNDGSSFTPDCEYIVEVQNDNVCQIRLDFEQFHLSLSEEIPVGDPANNIFQTVCAGDYMTVTPKVENVPQFCGNNEGQHAYIHLRSQKEVRLHVHLADRASTQDTAVTSVPNPRWRIKVTQLECPAVQNYFVKNKIYGLESDFRLLAPEGAAQYFTESTGRIRSFGFNGVQSAYISGMDYAIAFKRTPFVNCIQFTTNYITLRHNPIPPAINNDQGVCIDYLFIPDLVEISGATIKYGSRLCSEQTTAGGRHPQIVYSNAPGPFYIFFHSEPTYPPTLTEVHAFDINYELKTCN